MAGQRGNQLLINNGRISAKLRHALFLIVNRGYSVSKAAESIGYTREALYKNLKKENVIAEKEAIGRAFLSSATDLARFTLVDLCQNAKSEDVRHKAARTILELNGELLKNKENQELNFGGVNIMIVNNGDKSAENDKPLITNQETDPAIDADFKGIE